MRKVQPVYLFDNLGIFLLGVEALDLVDRVFLDVDFLL